MIPDVIRIGPYVYDVTREHNLSSDNHVRLQGQARHLDKRIVLDDPMTAQQERVTLLHEVLHVIEYERNLDLSENCVDQLSVGLADALLRNPLLLELFRSDR